MDDHQFYKDLSSIWPSNSVIEGSVEIGVELINLVDMNDLDMESSVVPSYLKPMWASTSENQQG